MVFKYLRDKKRESSVKNKNRGKLRETAFRLIEESRAQWS